MTIARSPLVAARRPRTLGQDWEQAKSWFGGRPRLGSLSWPRDVKTRAPLIFLAQIDLAEVAQYAPEFPAHGSLAFFVGPLGSCDGAIVYVPGEGGGRRSDPPSDAYPVRAIGSWPFEEDAGPGVEALFPYWPLQLKPLGIEVPELDADNVDLEPMTDDAVRAIGRLFPDGNHYPRARDIAALSQTPLPHWWYSAHFLTACLQNALHRAPKTLAARAPWLEKARTEYAALAKLAKPTFGIFGRRAAAPSPELQRAKQNLERGEAQNTVYHRDLPKFAALVKDSAAFAAGHAASDVMTDAEWQTLSGFFERARGEFEDFARYAVPYDLSEMEKQSLIYLLTADEKAYHTIPAAVRAYVNERCLLPSSGSWHQMFGVGDDIQGAIWENAEKILLLQLVYDEMMHWRFGDVGAYQFWISPKDVKARNWAGARLTFECH